MNSVRVLRRLAVLGCLARLALPPATAAQLPDGQIVFPAAEAAHTGAATAGSDDPTRGWLDLAATSDATVRWDFKPTRWGRYDVVVDAASAGPARLFLGVAGEPLTATLPARGGTGRTAAFTAGRIYLAKSDPFTVTLTNETSNVASVRLRSVTLRPAPEGDPVTQAADGTVTLRSSEATTHSTMLRYEPATIKNCLGYWVNPADWADWEFTLTRPGTYEIEAWQGCGRGHGGSDVAIEAGGRSFPFVVEETGHFQNFVPRRVGRVTFTAAGRQTLAVRPQRKQGAAVMDIRQVRLLPVSGPDPGPTVRALVGARRVAILGDSITYGGEWVEFVETYLRLRHPDSTVEIIDLGLPSETASGLSEPGHAGGQFPRPDVHERLGRVLEQAKPDLIYACYGMNDGIYHPQSPERFQKFQDGIRRLHERAEHEGVRVVHLTPAPFDPVPNAGRLLPAGRDAYPSPFADYDDVLGDYSTWLLAQRAAGWEVIDLHGPINRFLAGRRQTDPKFTVAGDGVHPNTQGHWLMAREVLRHLGAPAAIVDADSPAALVASHPRGAEVLKLVQQRQRATKDAWLTSVGHQRPGMNHGRPLAEVQAEAAQIAIQLRTLTVAQP